MVAILDFRSTKKTIYFLRGPYKDYFYQNSNPNPIMHAVGEEYFSKLNQSESIKMKRKSRKTLRTTQVTFIQNSVLFVQWFVRN
jgi:hypothetical protein